MITDRENFDVPIAEKMRPREFLDLIGQEKIWAEGTPLWALVKEDRFSSLIFWGPPGSGKTSLAMIIGNYLDRPVKLLSSVEAGVKEIREVILESTTRQKDGKKALLLFMDEIHRLNKNQQDVLLPALETGRIKFIGATTENPSFEVNPGVNSRSLVFKFSAISKESLKEILGRALKSPSFDLDRRDVEEKVLELIAGSANGDARRALNLLEAVISAAPPDVSPINENLVKKLSEHLNIYYDRAGDSHYDTISAFIKSIRASHPDAAIYYLARMLAAGEDPVFIARRLVVAASEDIGNANPTASLLAQNALEAVHAVGMPEARIILAQATTYLASSPKSNRSYLAIEEALNDVKEYGDLEIPLHIRNAPTEMMKNFGYHQGYVYPHDDLEGARNKAYLPEKLANRKYYDPKEIGAEKQLAENLKHLKPKRD